MDTRKFDPDLESVEQVDSIILWLLAASSVLAIFLFVVRGLLEQLPGVLTAWRRAKRAYRDADPSQEPEGRS